MPRGDGTGPMGMGPRSGRAAGYCAGFEMPGYANPVLGYGMGMGRGGRRGGGRGWRHWFYATGQPGWMRYGGRGVALSTPEPEMKKQALKNQVDALQSELEMVRKRLLEIETQEKVR